MVGERRAAQVGAMGERRAAQVGVTRLAQARAAGRREAWIRVQWRSAAASARVEGGAGGGPSAVRPRPVGRGIPG